MVVVVGVPPPPHVRVCLGCLSLTEHCETIIELVRCAVVRRLTVRVLMPSLVGGARVRARVGSKGDRAGGGGGGWDGARGERPFTLTGNKILKNGESATLFIAVPLLVIAVPIAINPDRTCTGATSLVSILLRCALIVAVDFASRVAVRRISSSVRS